MPKDAIRIEGVAKSFGPVVALRDVSLQVGHGEVVGLVGDNGAGKSTLAKILCGLVRPDAGRIFLSGKETVLRSPSHARSLGIDTVHQDLALVDELTVYQNVFLKRELVSWFGVSLLNKRAMKRQARDHLHQMRVSIPSVDAKVARLSGGQRQAIAIARAAYSGASILLLDEPLAAMGAKESKIVLDLLGALKEQGGVSMIIIVHNYAQVFEVCDRVSVLQHGRITFDRPTSATSPQEVMTVITADYASADAAGD